MMIDSGADICVISEADWAEIERAYLQERCYLWDVESDSNLLVRQVASRDNLEVKCTFKAWADPPEPHKPSAFVEFAVIGNVSGSLLGRKAAKLMRLLAVGMEVNAVQQIIDEPFPAIPNVEIDFEIDESVPPTQNAYFRLAENWHDPAVKLLMQMKAKDIIEPVQHAPAWVSPMGAVPKGKDGFRLVINMRNANKAIKRKFYPLPRIEQLRTRLRGAKIFSKLDLKSAYHHLLLTERSRDITTFMTPMGMFRFKRLMFGVNCAPEIFQREMEKILIGIPNIFVYLDDILMFAESKEDLELTTSRVLTALTTNNLTINEEKCEYMKENLTFLGHRISSAGMNIDEGKIESIRNFRKPSTAAEVRSFLGLASFLREYIGNFADLAAPLYSISSDKNFHWSEEQDVAFEDLRLAIIECTTTLGIFDPKDETFLYVDASQYALGAVLVQRDENRQERIISFASKALSSTERRYPQTQREALAIVWAPEHFHFYLLGLEFTIRTDSEGLKIAYSADKGIPKRMMKRFEGWALRLDNFCYKIEHVSGEENIADSPSRLHTGQSPEWDESAPDMDFCKATGDALSSFHEIATIRTLEADEIIFSEGHIPPEEVAKESQKDPELIAVTAALETGVWNESGDLSLFQRCKSELYTKNGVLVRKGLAVLPASLRRKAMRIAHAGHPGITKTKSILRDRVWWPRLDTDVENFVAACKACTLTGRTSFPTPMERSDMPEAPWDKLAIDFSGPYAQHGGKYLLVVVDYFSRYLTIAEVETTSFKCVEKALNLIFDKWGCPREIRSDNGPPFSSREFINYCRAKGIKPTKSDPEAPWQNGMAERYMRLVNKMMGSASVDGITYQEALAQGARAHNQSTHVVTKEIPFELMLNRKIRTGLPLMRPAGCNLDWDETQKRDKEAKLLAAERENRKRRAREPSIERGDIVFMEDSHKRKGDPPLSSTEMTVISRDKGSVVFRTPEGKIVKRSIVKVAKKHGERELEKSSELMEGDPTPHMEIEDSDPEITEEDGRDIPAPGEYSSEPRRSGRLRKPSGWLAGYVRRIQGGSEVIEQL